MGKDKSLLVDTLFDLTLTKEMIRSIREAVPEEPAVDIVVNTHVNGDHCYGNELFQGAQIIASQACAEEFAREIPPRVMVETLKAAPGMGTLGRYFTECFGRFDFEGIMLTPPTATFEKEMEIDLGSKTVRLIEVGPCHTRGDILVLVPENRLLFAGDILFVDGTPVMWEGPVANWVAACDRILDLDVETIVPGHGPVAGKKAVRQARDYWIFLEEQARKRFDEGVPSDEAARQLLHSPYSSWGDPERVVINVHTLYREFEGDETPPNRVQLFNIMAGMWEDRTGVR
ncbi:MBL fold metallo-hydrolase [Thermodesulfobacteriota bacterium]